MKKNIYLLCMSVLLPVAMIGQSTQALQNLLQAQMLNSLPLKFIVVNAYDTGLFCAKYRNLSFIEPFQEVRVGCSPLCQKQNRVCYAIIESSLSLTSEESLIYEAPFFEINNHDTVGVSHLFYVKIQSKADTVSLKRLAQEQNVEIIGFNQYMPLWYTLSCTKYSKGNALEMATVFRSSGLFEHSEPDLLVEGRLDSPNDPYFPYQWGLLNVGQENGMLKIDINALGAQKITTGNSSITVAVIDQGFELNHPDLCTISPYSYDSELDVSPSNIWGNHGTACAGIIGATINNNVGIAGIAPNSPLISISNILHSLMPDENQKLANGINQAWKHNAAVISNSWHYPFDTCAFISDAIDSAITFGRNGKGSVVVFAAGNNNDTVNYPACKENVISVGAIDRCGARSGRMDIVPESCEPWDSTNYPGSAFGDKLDVVAPGTHIYTTDRQGLAGYKQEKGTAGDYYEFFGGTSAACPHVAGVAALMLSVNPNLTSQEVRDIIEQTARKIRRDLYSYTDSSGHPNGEWNKYMGYGLLDAHRAVLKAAYHKVYGDTALTLCDTNRHVYTVRAPHNANIDSVSFFWTCSDNLQMVIGQYTDSVWVKRNHSGIGQLYCHIVHDGDTVVSTLDIPVASNRPVYDNVSLNNSVTYPDTFVLSREITVDSLVSLTWQNKTVLCTPDCRIIVRPGGYLTINHTTLTSACPGELWQGIEVVGNRTKRQLAQWQGTVELRNGAVIENAHCGIRTGLREDTVDFATTGGIITTDSAFFVNNRRAVAFLSYQNTRPNGSIADNISHFTDCEFVVDDNNLFAQNNCSFIDHVTMWKVRGVQFNGCRFSNSTTTSGDRHHAIYTEDAGFEVNTYCRAQYYTGCECPENKSVYCEFSGLSTAIEVNTTGDQHAVLVNRANFRNNGTGLKINGNNFATVTRNDFDLQCGFSSSKNTGLYLNNCSGYHVEENRFHRASGHYNYSSTGIKVQNSGVSDNNIYRNVFDTLDYGIYVSGTNGDATGGLQMLCGDFRGNGTDIYLATSSTIVSPLQGSLQSSAGNFFGKVKNYNIQNMSNQSLVYFYTGTPSSSNPYYPSMRTSNVLPYLSNTANSCISTLCGGGSLKSLSEFQSDMDTYTGSTQPLSDIYYTAVRIIMSDTVLDLNELEMWHTAAQPIGDPYSLTETRFMEGYAEIFAGNADDSEMANYADFHALKLLLRGDNNDNQDNNNSQNSFNSPFINWYALTPTQIAQLQTIAERNTGRASEMAKGVLCFFHGICYEDERDNAGAFDTPQSGDDTTGTRAKHIATDNPDDATLSVYPNPTDDVLFIELRGGAEIANVALYDLQGRIVGANNHSPLQDGTATITVKSIPAGVYVLRVTDADGKEYHQKIVRK